MDKTLKILSDIPYFTYYKCTLISLKSKYVLLFDNIFFFSGK